MTMSGGSIHGDWIPFRFAAGIAEGGDAGATMKIGETMHTQRRPNDDDRDDGNTR